MSKKRNPAPAYYDYNYGASAGVYDPGAEYKRLNKKLIPFNIIIAVIAIVGMVTLLIGNFWTFSVEMKFDQEMLQGVLGDAIPQGEEGSGEIPLDLSSLDLEVSFGFSIALEPEMLLKAATADNTAAVTGMIDPIINDFLAQAKDVFKATLKSVAKVAVATAINEFNNTVVAEAGAEAPEVAAAVEALDMEAINDTIDELLSDDPDIPQIKENFSDIIIEQALAQYELQYDEPLSEEDRAALESEIDTTIGTALDEVVEQMGGEENFNVNNIVMTMASETGFIEVPAGETLTDEDLTVALREKIMEGMDAKVIGYLATAFKVLSYMLIIPIAAWGLLAFFSFIRLFMKNKRVKMWFAKLVCALPYILFAGIPTLLIKYGPTLLAKYAPTLVPAELDTILSGLTISFTSFTWVSAICVAALYFVSIFFYNRIKRKAKRAKV